VVAFDCGLDAYIWQISGYEETQATNAMAAPPGLLLTLLIAGLLTLHRFSHVVLGRQREPAVFAVAATAVLMPVPVWSPAPTWAVALAVALVALWTIAREFTSLLQNTTVAAATLSASLTVTWSVAHATYGSPDWVVIIATAGSAVVLLALSNFLRQ